MFLDDHSDQHLNPTSNYQKKGKVGNNEIKFIYIPCFFSDNCHCLDIFWCVFEKFPKVNFWQHLRVFERVLHYWEEIISIWPIYCFSEKRKRCQKIISIQLFYSLRLMSKPGLQCRLVLPDQHSRLHSSWPEMRVIEISSLFKKSAK